MQNSKRVFALLLGITAGIGAAVSIPSHAQDRDTGTPGGGEVGRMNWLRAHLVRQ